MPEDEFIKVSLSFMASMNSAIMESINLLPAGQGSITLDAKTTASLRSRLDNIKGLILSLTP